MKKSEEIHKEAAGCCTGSAHLPLPEAGYLTSCHTTFQVSAGSSVFYPRPQPM